MTYLTKPERISVGTNAACNCNCRGNGGTMNNTVTCGGKCKSFKICVTPTGAKITPTGIGTAS